MPKYNFRSKKVKPEESESDDSDSDYETVDESTESESCTEDSETESESGGGDDDDDQDEEEEGEEDDDDQDEAEGECEEDNEANDLLEAEDLYKLLSEVFPSKYMNQKIEASRKLLALENVKNVKKQEKKQKDEKKDVNKKTDKKDKPKSEKKTVEKKSCKKAEKKSEKKSTEKKSEKKATEKKSEKTKKSKKNESSSDDDDDDDDDEDNLLDEDDDMNKINIFFTIDDGTGAGADADDFYDDEKEEGECDSEDEEVFMKETYEKIDESSNTNPEKQTNAVISTEKKTKKRKRLSQEEDDVVLKDVAQEYLDLVELRKDLIKKQQKSPKNKILKKAIEDCNKSIQKLVKKSRTRNLKTYHKLIKNSSGQNKMNEFDYFKTRMSNREQLKIMEDLKKINKHINIDKPYRLALLQSNIPTNFKALAMQKMNLLRTMEPGDSEYYKIKNWVDNFMRIPFGIYRNLPVQLSDGIELCQRFMESAKRTLDDCVYGMEDAKMQIMQLIGQWIMNPASIGTAIAIKGAAGIGKTTLVRDGISKILGRDFSFIPLGGCSDGSYLTGNGYVYEGASHGKIVQVLIDSKSMNPVIFFDELDKVSETPKGEEITGVLTHLTDTTQNSQYHDKYFSEIDFDTSKCLYIFSYNDESKVNPILKDRMYRIEIKGYETKDKIIIAKNYLLPKIREMVAFSETDVIIPDETIEYIANNKQFSQDEKGVRNLKRCLEIIYTKLNLFRLTKKEHDIVKHVKLSVEFPFTVTKEAVDQLIKQTDVPNISILSMYI